MKKLFAFIKQKVQSIVPNTDTSMKAGVIDVIVRAILAEIGTGDIAEDANEIDIYCEDELRLELSKSIREELFRQISTRREDLAQLAESLRGSGFKMVCASAPKGAIPVDGMKMSFVLKKTHMSPRSIAFYDERGLQNEDGSRREPLFRMAPPESKDESPRCYIGRNVSGQRHNDISLDDTRVSRRQAMVIWIDGRWMIQSECDHTWVDRTKITGVGFVALKDHGTINCSDPTTACPKILFHQEELCDNDVEERMTEVES